MTDSGGNQFISAPLTLGSNLAISTTSGSVLTISGAIGGVFNLTTSGSGLLVLSGANSFSGSTTISGGTLQVGSGGAAGSIGSTSSVSNSGVLEFDLASNVTFSQAISGAGSLTQAGIGALILTGSNTYSGLTTISAGTLQVGSGGTAGSIGGTSGVSNNGVLAFDLSSTATFSQAVTGAGSLVQAGAGALILTGSNAYSGGTTLGGGTLQVGNSLALGSTAASLTVTSPAELDLHGFSIAVGQLSGSGLIDDRASGDLAKLTLAPLPGTTTFSGNIQNGSGTVALLVSGGGTEVLAGSNSYGGGTTVSGGTLDFVTPGACPARVSSRSRAAAAWCWGLCWRTRRLRLPTPDWPSRPRTPAATKIQRSRLSLIASAQRGHRSAPIPRRCQALRLAPSSRRPCRRQASLRRCRSPRCWRCWASPPPACSGAGGSNLPACQSGSGCKR